MLGPERRRLRGPKPGFEQQPREEVVPMRAVLPLVGLVERALSLFFSEDPRELVGAGHEAKAKSAGKWRLLRKSVVA
jgi:hypothetical protein